jgi:hypothetical protein
MKNSQGTRHQEQLQHLAQVRALIEAIESGILAIEKNDLARFETHLAEQEVISNRLSAIPLTSATLADAEEEPDEQTFQEIRRTHLKLAQLNRVYAAVLKSANRSVTLIVTLYRSYREGYDQGSPSQPRPHSLSCEV